MFFQMKRIFGEDVTLIACCASTTMLLKKREELQPYVERYTETLKKAGKRYGAEFVRVEGKRSFARAISQNPEDLTLYAERFAYLCKELHNTPCSQNDFESEVDFYHRIINQNPDYSASEKQRLHEFVNQVPVEYTCIHGDLHIGNVITANGKDFWIDLGDFRWGNHWFDLGMLYFVCKCWREEPVFELFHISKEQLADAVIHNNGTLEDTAIQLQNILYEWNVLK